MSAVANQEVLTPILLRSTTPAPSEKVMKYLQGMTRQGEEPDNRPPRSVLDSAEYRSNMSAQRSPPTSHGSLRNGNGHMSFHDGGVDGEDADSNFQEGRTSEIGDLDPTREPGPNDPPGPKYESYDSGPSFGNFGPLPTDDGSQHGNPYAFPSWNPNLSDIMGSPNGQTVNNAANVPLPPSEFVGSPRAPSARIDGHSTRTRSQAGTPMSPKMSERVMSPKSTARSNGRGLEDDRPLSPMSAKSKATAKTRGSEKGTVYPPLPESRYGEGESNWDIGSPRSRAFSKAPSISPSDSPSNFKPPKPASNGVSRPPVISSPTIASHQSRPFSPYRHAPTHADLLYAATRNRSLVIPEEDEKASSEGGKTASALPSLVSKVPSQVNGKAPSQAPSRMPSQAPSQPPSRMPSQAPSQVHSQVHSQTPSQVHSQNHSQVHSQVPSRAPSQVPSQPPLQQTPKSPSKTPTKLSTRLPSQLSEAPPPQPSMLSSRHDKSKERARSPTPEGLDPEEARIVADALGGLTPRTSYYADQPLEPEVTDHYHDTELCVLLHQEADETLHELVRKALRKAIRQRVKRLGMKYDVESIKQFRKSYHDHNPSVHLLSDHLNSEEPPQWAVDLKNDIAVMQQHLQSINENLRPQDQSFQDSRFEGDEYTRTPVTRTVNIESHRTEDLVDSMYQNQPEQGEVYEDNSADIQRHLVDVTSQGQDFTLGRDDSPGSIVLEKELYKLRQKPASQSGRSHRTWEVTRDEDGEEFDDEEGVSPSGLPTIPDTNADAFVDGDRSQSPPLPPIPTEGREGDDLAVVQQQHRGDISDEHAQHQVPPWQKIHQRLLNWAMIWPTTEFDQALNSTSRGNQVDEVSLSIWATQTYKRYVRARLTEGPSGVDRLFVPPNMADVINNAVFNGRHGEACGMLKDLWTPFGLEGMPRLIIVLAKHRSEANHWVVHRFSLPEGKLATYDTYQDRTLPDGRPLGWWFAIRIAWPNAPYPSPESLVQKMIRLHRPMQLNIDNSVAAAGIWRNLLMGSRAERSLDLERLRDLINTEVKNLRQRKQLGKLSTSVPRLTWDEMGV